MITKKAVSCFDQRLSEDFKVNRLEDSFLLWQTICASKLLSKANTILFLNKIDLLDRKLLSGIKINQYLPSYGERANDTKTVLRCEFFFLFLYGLIFFFVFNCGKFIDLRTKFKDILKQHSTEERCGYYYATTAIVRCYSLSSLIDVAPKLLCFRFKDTKATASTIKAG